MVATALTSTELEFESRWLLVQDRGKHCSVFGSFPDDLLELPLDSIGGALIIVSEYFTA